MGDSWVWGGAAWWSGRTTGPFVGEVHRGPTGGRRVGRFRHRGCGVRRGCRGYPVGPVTAHPFRLGKPGSPPRGPSLVRGEGTCLRGRDGSLSVSLLEIGDADTTGSPDLDWTGDGRVLPVLGDWDRTKVAPGGPLSVAGDVEVVTGLPTPVPVEARLGAPVVAVTPRVQLPDPLYTPLVSGPAPCGRPLADTRPNTTDQSSLG